MNPADTALSVLREARARFCLDPKRLARVACARCRVGREGACVLRRSEVSAVQSQLNKMAADMSDGHAAWRSEYQLDPVPPEERALVLVDASAVASKTHGLPRGVAPDVYFLHDGASGNKRWATGWR